MGDRIYYILFFLALSNGFLSQNFERIIIDAGPEDFLIDTFNTAPRLLISCDERRDIDRVIEGNIWQMDLHTDAKKILPRKNDSSISFNPHGIHLITENNTKYLFVVNHYYKNKKSEVIRFRLDNDTLYWEKRFPFNSLINSVCAVSKEHFYFTNDRPLKR